MAGDLRGDATSGTITDQPFPSRRSLRLRAASASVAPPTPSADGWVRPAPAVAPPNAWARSSVLARPADSTGAEARGMVAQAVAPSPAPAPGPMPVLTPEPASVPALEPAPAPGAALVGAASPESVSLPRPAQVPENPSAGAADGPARTELAAPEERPAALPSDRPQDETALRRPRRVAEEPRTPTVEPEPEPEPEPGAPVIGAAPGAPAPAESPHVEVSSSGRSAGPAPRRIHVTALEAIRDVVGLGTRSGKRRWSRTLQAAVAAATLVTVVVGVRTIFSPVAAESVPYSATFPEALAVSTAERFAEAYYTWDEADEDGHAAAIAEVMVAGVSRQAGWDGTGRSEAGQASASGFSLVDAGNAIVTVVVPVTEYSGHPGAWRRAHTAERALSVPVTVIDARTWVSGLPAAVGVPVAPQGTPTTPAEQDRAVTEQTRDVVSGFFRSLAQTDTTTDGARGRSITGLAGTLVFDSLGSWTVEQSDGPTKTGIATVRWTTGEGASLEQQYRVVVGRQGASWTVTTVTAAFAGGTP